MIVFIINYNRLILPGKMADWCYLHGLDPVFIDNHSDYPPLLEYYSRCLYQVVQLEHNYGHTVLWNGGNSILDTLIGMHTRYIVSDPDLNLEGIPNNFLSILGGGLNKFPHIDKCGFSLEINDLPNTKEGNYIRTQVEPRYWRKKYDNLYYNAPIDTTFALYREGVRHYSHTAVRTERPYTAKHVPWYYSDLTLLSEDEQYYYQTADMSSATGKKRLVK
jgi:hypothetical protein